jgi:hypothetical protein
VYSELEKTVHDCRTTTASKYFKKGVAYHNQGTIYFNQGDYSRWIAYVELAIREDRTLKHKGQAHRDLVTSVDSICEFISSDLNLDTNFSHINPKAVIARLIEGEKYRLIRIMLEFQHGLKDMRSLAVRDTAETNIMRICKLTETYLKRKLGKSKTLNPLIQNAFTNSTARISKAGHDWLKDWQTNWLNGKMTDYRSIRDDTKIEQALKFRRDSVTQAFNMLTLLRNFTAHIHNDNSILFRKYAECFNICVRAFLYSVRHV